MSAILQQLDPNECNGKVLAHDIHTIELPGINFTSGRRLPVDRSTILLQIQ